MAADFLSVTCPPFRMSGVRASGHRGDVLAPGSHGQVLREPRDSASSSLQFNAPTSTISSPWREGFTHSLSRSFISFDHVFRSL